MTSHKNKLWKASIFVLMTGLCVNGGLTEIKASAPSESAPSESAPREMKDTRTHHQKAAAVQAEKERKIREAKAKKAPTPKFETKSETREEEEEKVSGHGHAPEDPIIATLIGSNIGREHLLHAGHFISHDRITTEEAKSIGCFNIIHPAAMQGIDELAFITATHKIDTLRNLKPGLSVYNKTPYIMASLASGEQLTKFREEFATLLSGCTRDAEGPKRSHLGSFELTFRCLKYIGLPDRTKGTQTKNFKVSYKEGTQGTEIVTAFPIS